MKIITVASRKGGVGKTTTGAALAAALGQKASTLLFDGDPQGQCGLSFGLDSGSGVSDWWLLDKPLHNCVVAARLEPYLWILPGDSRTAGIERQPPKLSQAGFLALIDKVRGLLDHFYYVVVDTAASGRLQQVMLAAADHIVVPFKAERLGVDGVDGTLALLAAMEEDGLIRPSRTITLLPVDFHPRWREHKRNLATLREAQGDLVAERPIRHRIAVGEAVSEGKSIWEYEGNGIEEVREDYMALLVRLLGEEEMRPKHRLAQEQPEFVALFDQ